MHPISFKNPDKTFCVLAESSNGPIIISLNNDIFGTVFSIDNKYKETVGLLENYIRRMMIEIHSNSSIIPIERTRASKSLRLNEIENNYSSS